MNEELEVLKVVCGHLEEGGIPYMITGSIAANFYAAPRMTRDVDIVIEIAKGGVDRIDKLFKNDFYVDAEAVRESVEKEGMFNIIHNEFVIKIDFIVRKDSPYRLLEFKRRRQVEMDGIPLSIVSPEDLILSKLCWAKDSFSDFQLRDVKNLMAGVKNLDLPYIEKWVIELGLDEIYRKAKKAG